MIDKSFRYYITFSEFAVIFREKYYLIKYVLAFFAFATASLFQFDKIVSLLVSRHIRNIKISNEILFFTFTLNQRIASERIISEVDNYGGYDFIKINSRFKLKNYILILATIKSSIKVLKGLYGSYNKNYIRENPRKYVELFGYAYIFQELLSSCKILIHFNDHSLKNVLLYDIAKLNNIKTVYIQHAPVSDRFPELYNDLNVLFSKDSERKYSNKNNKSVFVFYDCRYSSFKSIRKFNFKAEVLICTNSLDSIQKVYNLVQFLKINNINSFIRKHPGDKRDWGNYDFQFSVNKKVDEDLKYFDIILCNESAIILDAIFYQNLLYVCPFIGVNDNFIDCYGYFNDGLLKTIFLDKVILLNAINNRISTYNSEKLDYYVGNIAESAALNEELRRKITYM